MRVFSEQPPSVRTLTLPGSTDPALVFLHGLGSAGVPAFGAIAVDAAFEGRERLLPDLLGFGFSDRPLDFGYSLDDHAAAVADLLDQRNLTSVDLVGHSLGGSIATVLAYRRPDLVGRLIVLEPNLLPWDGTASVEIARQSEPQFVDTGIDRLIADADPEWASTLRIADPIALHRTAVGLCVGPDSTVQAVLESLRVPRIFAYGERTGAPSQQARLASAGVAFACIDNAGHVMMADNSDGVVEVLRAGLLL
ncbi:alpha/beta fold hydrolase [Rhodococcoides yunnanense]|uniref:Alpha/beta fold hydrolase n=1 Tax=Rhodococcoides yunnanense TaxID=278209 RepID=A0ABU4B8B1_9NOCA|nr:alpha/beta fold hydrolase [Rhodococcus yunnanensis]MDV6260417.1 alpha/beta fold hydrolase [Rhodococcus yunnanensis]